MLVECNVYVNGPCSAVIVRLCVGLFIFIFFVSIIIILVDAAFFLLLYRIVVAGSLSGCRAISLQSTTSA